MLAVARKGWQIDSGIGARFDKDLVESCRSKNKLPGPSDFPVISVPNGTKQKRSVRLENNLYLMKNSEE